MYQEVCSDKNHAIILLVQIRMQSMRFYKSALYWFVSIPFDKVDVTTDSIILYKKKINIFEKLHR